jgi:transposase
VLSADPARCVPTLSKAKEAGTAMTSMTKTLSAVTDDPTGEVTGGVDTHGATNHAAVIDHVGRHLADREFPTTATGYRDLLIFLKGFGVLRQVGVEGTGTYGAGLARYLHQQGVKLLEVDRTDRKSRRAKGKSDPLDAYSAARAALNGTAAGTPKTRDGITEAIRALRVARNSAIKARTQTSNQMKALLVSGPAGLREQLRQLCNTDLIQTCSQLRPAADLSQPLAATKSALRTLARRHQYLTAEIKQADSNLKVLVTAAAPQLLTLIGVGVEIAGQLLVTAGDNPDRLHSEAAFAHLAGVAPVPASSGRIHRHRLNRHGDRDANRALYLIVITRLQHHTPTKIYMQRRTNENMPKNDIIRCLKRFIAREIFHALTQATPSPANRLNTAA